MMPSLLRDSAEKGPALTLGIWTVTHIIHHSVYSDDVHADTCTLNFEKNELLLKPLKKKNLLFKFPKHNEVGTVHCDITSKSKQTYKTERENTEICLSLRGENKQTYTHTHTHGHGHGHG
jgi:hypothetical protein